MTTTNTPISKVDTRLIDTILNNIFTQEILPAGINPNQKKRFLDGAMKHNAKIRILTTVAPYKVKIVPVLIQP